jgi:transcriptional regulator GlxA family with amidase domain
MAAELGMSPRNFARRFADAFDETPARLVERLRVARARSLIEDTPLPFPAICRAAGFGDERTMRRAFRRVLGVPPQDCAATLRRERPLTHSPGEHHAGH